MNFPIRICFLGTPAFAAAHLKTLLEDPRFLVVGVVTQPDRPAGRKMQMMPSAVKTLALENQLEVVTPENLKKDLDTFEKIKLWNADIAIVVAFGQILTEEFLNYFPLGSVNIHGSLLPLWRGAAPIQRSLEAGDTFTGVCLQKMVKKLDAGPLIGERLIKLRHLVGDAIGDFGQKIRTGGSDENGVNSAGQFDMRHIVVDAIVPGIGKNTVSGQRLHRHRRNKFCARFGHYDLYFDFGFY